MIANKTLAIPVPHITNEWEKMEYIRYLVRTFLPNAPTITPFTMQAWLLYDLRFVERGLLRASKKFKEPYPEGVFKYVTAVARDEFKKYLEQSARQNGVTQ